MNQISEEEGQEEQRILIIQRIANNLKDRLNELLFYFECSEDFAAVRKKRLTLSPEVKEALK